MTIQCRSHLYRSSGGVKLLDVKVLVPTRAPRCSVECYPRRNERCDLPCGEIVVNRTLGEGVQKAVSAPKLCLPNGKRTDSTYPS
ncbi:MAG: hypothetical protein J07HQX50_00153 [Haloquadratum sp. J07HQX50]|nr:MAG: hypothetical protein J07HQX50_00153 [Haloquadratum sp. J07HQX50]